MKLNQMNLKWLINTIDLGLEPITLKNGLMTEIIDVAEKYKSRINKDKIPPMSFL